MDAERNRDDIWRDLAERLLGHPYPGGPDMGTRVVLGGVPDGWRDVIPIPEGWRVVGSSLHHLDALGGGDMVDVVIDADGDANTAMSKLEAAANAAGWEPYEDVRPMHGGFVPATSPGAWRTMQRGDTLLRGVAIERGEGALDIRLHLNADEVRRMRRAPAGVPRAAALVPQLAAPKGLRLVSGRGGGSMDHYDSSATIHGDAAARELHAHFVAQLEAAAWVSRGQYGDQRVAWSDWQLPQQQGDGLLIIRALSEARRIALTIRVDMSTVDGDGDGASFSVLRSHG